MGSDLETMTADRETHGTFLVLGIDALTWSVITPNLDRRRRTAFYIFLEGCDRRHMHTIISLLVITISDKSKNEDEATTAACGIVNERYTGRRGV
jgi:hypothetical protein